MPKVINNQQTTNNYSDPGAVGIANVFESQGGWIVNNGQILCQQQVSLDAAQGSDTYSDEFPLPAGAHYLQPGTIGFRCRSFSTNTPVTVSICLFQKYEPAMILGSFGVASTVSQIITQQILTTLGAGTYTTPAGVLAIFVECIAGGGSSGGVAGVVGDTGISSPGSGGGYSASLILAPAATYAVNVGAGGNAPVGSNPGLNGGATTFGGTLIVALGGVGGARGTAVAAAGSQQGTPGAAIGVGGGEAGNITLQGGPGTPSIWLTASAGPIMGGLGGEGAGPYGGKQTNGLITGGSGLPGNKYGGGGSSAATINNVPAAAAGAAGANGVIIVTEFY